MLKKAALVVTAGAAGLLMFGGMASAQESGSYGHHGHHDHGQGGSQVGLVNLNNIDVLHNLNPNIGACGNDINVLGVQVPIRKSLNGIAVPVLSPGENGAGHASSSTCASSGLVDGGSSQHN